MLAFCDDLGIMRWLTLVSKCQNGTGGWDKIHNDMMMVVEQ